MRPGAAASVALALLAGCASSVDWQKPGATSEATNADVRACRGAAQATPILGRPQTTPSGAILEPSGTDLNADRQMQEAQRVQDCMRQKGYGLGPRTG